MTEFEISEITKCSKDIMYFLNTYLDYNNPIIDFINNNKFLIVRNNYRKLKIKLLKGITTDINRYNHDYIYYFLIHYCLFKTNCSVIISNVNFNNDSIISLYKKLPDFFKKLSNIKWDKYRIQFPINRNNIFIKNNNLSLGISANLTIVGNDYKLSKDKLINLYQSIYPVISARQNDKLIITGNYEGFLKDIYDTNNLYKKLYNNI